ncbi:MAG: BspA family leucine-rich repeat surface protein [Porphyromonadaceae bacterium]|nr:BspA family leucine-rich repeat surface protein [Porphyromonadaceae bacterium]
MKKIFLQVAFLFLLLIYSTGTTMAQVTPFVSIWDSRKESNRTGNSNTTIALNFIGTNYTIEWQNIDDPSQSGTLTVASSTTANPYILTVPVAGRYRIKAYPLTGLYSGNILSGQQATLTHDPKKLITVESWGNTQWTSLNAAFQGADNMDVTATDIPVLTNVTSLTHMFSGCKKLVYNNSINNWDVSRVTNMIGMFRDAIIFNQPLGSWVVSNVTTMSVMFQRAEKFNHNINSWDVSNVEDMSSMFYGAKAFNSPLNNWNTSNVTNMGGMFFSAVAFNSPINSWNTSNVTNMGTMFRGAVIFNQPLDNWNTSNVENMSSMFWDAKSFNQPLSTFVTSKVKNMESMFRGATLFNQPIGNWNTVNVTSMSNMFANAKVFDQPIGGWNTSNVTLMDGMFNEANKFNQPIDTWNTSNATNMSSMFRSATLFNQPIGSWDVSKVTNMDQMFAIAKAFNQDISSWNTGQVQNMTRMFYGAENFNTPIGSWVTDNVTDMRYMFARASSFNQEIGRWNVSKVTNMDSMFLQAGSFNQNLSTWSIRSLTSALNMFNRSTMDCNNYSLTLAGWAKNPNTASNVTLTVEGCKYNRLGLAGRNALIAKGWTISGDTYVRECTPGETDGDFVSVWNTENQTVRLGWTARDIAIPAIGTNYTIEWIRLDPYDKSETTQRGIVTNATSTVGNPYILLNLPIAGEYRIRLSVGIGSLEGFYMEDNVNVYDHERLTKIEHWGDTKWTRLNHAFYRAKEMDVSATDVPDLSRVDDIAYMFAECRKLVYSNVISSWNVSNIKNMSHMFDGAVLFNQDINSWNTENVNDMSSMFAGAKVFNKPLDQWNVAKVVNMYRMFNKAISFNQSLGSWNLRSLSDAREMLDNDPDEGIDCYNYSATLIGWAENSNTPNNITLGAKNRFFNRTAKAAHDKLTLTKHWTIIVDTFDPNCGGASYVWIGTVSDDFGTSFNWLDGIAPKPDGNVEFATVDNYGSEAVNNMKIDGPNRKIGNLMNNSSKATVIPSGISLTVSGELTGSETMNEANKLLILSSKDQPNGTLILAGQPASTPVYATVEMYSKAKKGVSQTWVDNIEGSPTKGQSFKSSFQWQYIGVPVESVVTNDAFYKGYIRRYDETYNGDNTRFYQKWRKVGTYDVLTAFTGYEITQKEPATYTAQGKLNIGDKDLVLTRRAPRVTGATNPDDKINHWGLGQNIFGNSYTASIQIDKIEFPDEVEKTVYLYNTGSFVDWMKNPSTTSETDIPGAYLAIPQNVSPAIYRNGIPSMQGFMLKFTDDQTIFGGADATVRLKYDDGGVGRNSKPQKAPSLQDYMEEEVIDNIGYIRIGLRGESSADVMWMIEMPNTTDGFDNGYDGFKMMSTNSSATIFTDINDGHLQVSTSNSVLNKPFSFRSNSVGEYKLTLVKSNLGHYSDLHLVDMMANKYVSLDSDSTVYTFTTDNVDKIEKRFMIVNESPTTGTDIANNPYLEALDAYMSDNSTLVVNNMTSSNGTVTILDVSGRTVLLRDIQQGFSQIPVSLTSGVYMVSLQTAKNSKMVKIIIK